MSQSEEKIICVCCGKNAVVIFHEATALCIPHGIIYQKILKHEGQGIEIEIMEDN